MPPQTKIIKYGLESRTRELYNADFSLSSIADTLSNESGQTITKAMVFHYLGSEARCNAEVIEKTAKLKVAVAEAEISTIEDRKTIIKSLLELAGEAKYDRDKIAAYKVATESLDALDKRIGKLSNNSSVTINNVNAMKLEDIPTEQLLRMINAST